MRPDRRPDAARFGRRLLVLCAVLALVLFGLVSAFPSRRWGEFDALYIARYGLILAFVVFGLAATRRRLAVVAVELSVWLMAMLVLVVGYSYRTELQDLARGVRSELVPGHGVERAPGVVSFTRSSDGQFWIMAQVDGQPVRFLVDTGASDVVLSRADAARLGFTADRLSFSEEADTANGRIREAPVMLGELRIGSIRFEHVPAAVSSGGFGDSLLGMRVLERLSSVEIRKDNLTIRE